MTAESPESSIPDEEWAKFQLESEGPARLAAPKEPSARARMVTERLRRADEEATRRQGRVRRLTRRGKPVQARPDGWRAWPDRQAPKPRSRVRGFVWVGVAVVLVLVAMNPERVFGWAV
ncbi:hypothetical protein ACWD01_10640 [Streptomyces sp. NPDC002835]